MVSDELDDRLRRAARPEPEAVERMVRAALTNDERTRVRAWPRAVAALATGLVAVAALGVWWSARQPTTAPGVYRVEIVSNAAPEEPAKPVSLSDDGVFRVEATPTVAQSGVIRVTADDGTTWILGTTPSDDWLPPGSGVVLGGGAAR
jgi:hypothetical protein